MELLFFNVKENLQDIASAISELLGTHFLAGDSKNVLNEIYFEATLYGMSVRIEENSYDYEDQFEYMLSITRDVMRDISVRENDIRNIARLLQHLLGDNLKIYPVLEIESGLEES